METYRYCLIVDCSTGTASSTTLTELEIHKEESQVFRYEDGIFKECVCSQLETGGNESPTVKLLWADVNTPSAELHSMIDAFMFGEDDE